MDLHWDLIEQIFKAHERFIQTLDPSFFSAFLKKQEPYITLVTCSDSRVQSEFLGISAVNNIFVIRNIGNQLLTNLGSVDYGIYHLKTPLLIILGHVRCGAVTAALKDYTVEEPSVIRELNNLCIPLKRVSEKRFKRFHDLVEETVLENIHFQVEVALKRYKEKVEKGELTILGLLYDFANLYGKGKGAILIANINGLKDLKEVLEKLPSKGNGNLVQLLEDRFVTKHWYL